MTDSTDATTPIDSTDTDLSFRPPDSPDITIQTDGGRLRRWLRQQHDGLGIDEAKWRFNQSGIHVSAVDPANVGMVDTTLPAAAINAYSPPDDDATVGVPLDLDSDADLSTALQYARMGRGSNRGDPVRVDVIQNADGTTRFRVEIIRPDQGVRRATEFFTIKPGSIREEPQIPDLNLRVAADVDVSVLRDIVTDADTRNSSLLFTADGNTLRLQSVKGGRDARLDAMDTAGHSGVDTVDSYELPGTAWATDDPDAAVSDMDGSLVSLDYLKPMLTELGKADVATARLKLGDELPVKLSWESTRDGHRGTFMVAPRIKSDD